jgi:histidinol-phosphate aminotransferase
MEFNYIDSSTNFLTLIFNNNNKATRFVEQMMRNGVILRGLKSFGLPNCVRVTVGTQEENEYFIKQLNSIINEI